MSDAALPMILAEAVPGGRLVRSWAAAGGISSITTMVEVEAPSGERLELVVRRRSTEPGAYSMTIEDEVRLLRLVEAAGLPAPRVRSVDLSRSLVPEPLCVLDLLAGDQRFVGTDDPVAFGEAFADPLARIHQLDGDDPAFAFVQPVADRFTPWLDRPVERHDPSMGETAILDALRPHWPPPPPPQAALLHGDYWPGNVLWTGDRISAVIDWADAVRGDPLADVATLRLDLRFTGGVEATDAFTARYLALSGVDPTALPVWELAAALRPCGYVSVWAKDLAGMGGQVTPASMRADHAAFVAEAISRLG